MLAVACLAALLAAAGGGQVEAAPALNVSADQAVIQFPDTVAFHIDVTASGKVNSIVLEYGDASTAKIRHLQVVSDAEYILRGGGEEHSFATLRLRQIGPGQRVVIYFSGPTRIQPNVSVTHYEGG